MDLKCINRTKLKAKQERYLREKEIKKSGVACARPNSLLFPARNTFESEKSAHAFSVSRRFRSAFEC